MRQMRTIRGGWRAAILCCALSAPLFAQVSSYGDKQSGENAGDQLPQVLQKVGVSQHLNQQLPLDAAFVDESGKAVRLGDYFGKKAAILALVYYTCPMLCSEEMDGLTSSLEMVKLLDRLYVPVPPVPVPREAI